MASPSSNRARPWIVAALIASAALLLPAAAAAAVTDGSAAAVAGDEPQVAPPATRAETSSCRQQTAEAERTKHEIPEVSGVIVLTGCVADASGIEHLLLSWIDEDEKLRGRMCTDPGVVDSVWKCVWDTRSLPPGRYEVRMVAIDAAGNRGRFDRSYDVVEAPPNDTVPGQPTPTDPDAQGDDSQPRAPGEEFLTLHQRMVVDRIRDCERGGTPDAPTDADDVVTQEQQALDVIECLGPVLRVAGALDVRLDETIPVPPTILVLLEPSRAGAELRAVIPQYVAGVPIRLAEPEPEPEPEAEPKLTQL